MVKNLSAKQTMQARSLVWEDPLEEEMAPRSSILAWEIHRQRSLVGDRPGGRKESDDGATNEQQQQHSFAGAALTERHRPDGLDNRCLLPLNSGSWKAKSKVAAGSAPPKVMIGLPLWLS